MVEDRLIEVRAEPRGDGEGLRIDGLPPGRARTTRDRLRAALVNSGIVREGPAVTLRVLPALPGGCGRGELDLALALAALSSTGLGNGLDWILAEGRLRLDGSVRDRDGAVVALPAILGALVTGAVKARTYVRGDEHVSELRSAIESYRYESLPELPDARLEEDFAELQRASELLEVERLRRLAELERRGLYERDGHLSAAAWLARRHRVAPGVARGDLQVAKALEHMPVTRQALQESDISLSAAKVLVGVRTTDPDSFSRSERELVEAARIHSTGDLQRVAAYWRQAVEREAAVDPEEQLRARRRLHASVTFMGMVRLDGDLDPETGETLLTALRAVLDAEARSGADDERSPAQRRADALGEICRGWLEAPDRGSVAGERPHVTVTVDAAALRGSPVDTGTEDATPPGTSEVGLPDPVPAARPAELDHTGPVPASTARRLACDAAVLPVVLAGRSEPLDVGRRTKVVPPALRRAVIVRDRGCRFPGCDRPHTWCDAHHVVHWADGGPTALANLLLPSAPPDGPPPRRVPPGARRRSADLLPAGRVGAGGVGAGRTLGRWSGAAVALGGHHPDPRAPGGRLDRAGTRAVRHLDGRPAALPGAAHRPRHDGGARGAAAGPGARGEAASRSRLPSGARSGGSARRRTPSGARG